MHSPTDLLFLLRSVPCGCGQVRILFSTVLSPRVTNPVNVLNQFEPEVKGNSKSKPEYPLVMLVYPLYASVVAMESTTKVDDEQWLAYWIIYSFLTLTELILQSLLEWIPIWYSVKLVFVAWLVLPQFHGAAFIYNRVVREQFKKHGFFGSSFHTKHSKPNIIHSIFHRLDYKRRDTDWSEVVQQWSPFSSEDLLRQQKSKAFNMQTNVSNPDPNQQYDFTKEIWKALQDLKQLGAKKSRWFVHEDAQKEFERDHRVCLWLRKG
ncbi:unnamed protein product [Brassica napus]|uniref:HVA22-like protein n=2 Tax=Brassica TaxID=3705 RepID=A0A816R7M5_BRANA|nr:unnamed protein product [Brassica napus]